MKNILITGATGLLGSNLVSYLLSEDNEPKRIICLTRGHVSSTLFPFRNQVKMVFGDINDYEFVDSVVNHFNIDYIYHLAAEAIVRAANESPLRALDTNIMGTANVLESARQNHVKGIIAMASDKYYGQNPNIPYKETYAPDSTGIYEVSKTCSDHLCYAYGKNFDVPVISVRGSNLFGPGDWNFTRLVPNTMIRLIEGKKPVLWSDVKEYVREFIYVKDAVEILTRLIKTAENNAGEPVNLGVGEIWKVHDFIHEIILSVNFKGKMELPLDIDVKIKEHYFHEIPKQSLDLTKLKSLIGELPTRTKNLTDCFWKTYEFYSDVQRASTNTGAEIRIW